jgi:hypothetical protein
MPAGSITLADIAERTAVLAMACTRCDRAERYKLDTLIARHGPRLAIRNCCGGCAASIVPNYRRCSWHIQLAELIRAMT